MKDVEDKATLGEKREANTANGRSGMILEYIKTLITWPLILGAFMLIYGERLMTIAENRQIKAGPSGLEIGDRIETSKQQLVYLDEIVGKIKSNPTDAQKVTDLAKELSQSIQSFRKGLSQDIQNTPIKISIDDIRSAEEGERKGFEYILSKDIDAAISSFAKAEKLWPTFHNVGEIRGLLESRRPSLSAASETERDGVWQEIYGEILSKYSWGIPADVRTQIRSRLNLHG
jgi:hypothetical protein